MESKLLQKVAIRNIFIQKETSVKNMQQQQAFYIRSYNTIPLIYKIKEKQQHKIFTSIQI